MKVRAERHLKRKQQKLRKSKRMRFLSTTSTVALPVKVMKPLEDGKSQEFANPVELFCLLFKQYQPTQKTQLTTGELRGLNRLIDIFEKPSDNGHFVMDEADWKVGKQIIEGFAPLTGWARNAPALEDIWNAAVTEKPKA